MLNESFSSPEIFKSVFDAFVEEWNFLLAHPFRWSYDGKGLHELAVKRFTTMLINSAEQMEIRILTKGFGLMINLLKTYELKVSEEIWKRLINTVLSRYKTISKLIEQEKGPKRKIKAEIVFGEFMEIGKRYLRQTENKAA